MFDFGDSTKALRASASCDRRFERWDRLAALEAYSKGLHCARFLFQIGSDVIAVDLAGDLQSKTLVQFQN